MTATGVGRGLKGGEGDYIQWMGWWCCEGTYGTYGWQGREKGTGVGIRGCWSVDGLDFFPGIGWMRMEGSEGI